MLRSQRRGRDPPCWLSEKEPLVGKRRVNFQRCWLPVSRIGLHRRGVERVNCGPKLLDLGEKGVYSSYTFAIAPPNGTPDLYKEVAQRSTGYVYLLSRAGITGTDKTAGRPGEAEIAALRAAGSAPLLLGFGVSRPEHVCAALEAGADGAIAGSAVAQVITENLSNVPVMLERLTAFVKEMKAATALR